MAIKNWTVKTKQIKSKSKGLINHFNYLFNDKRQAHFYSEIVDLNNSPDKLSSILEEVDNRREYRRENGLRGGGVSNLATSFVLSLPREITQPSTKKEWQNIAGIALRELAKDINMPFEKIQKNAVVVLHDESNSVDKSSHIHILVGNVIDGKVVKSISQYQGTYSMKKGFNKAVKHVLKEDNNDYIPLNENVGDKPLHVSRAEKAEKRDQELDQKNQKMLDSYENKKSELSNTVKEFKKEKSDFNVEKSKFQKSIRYAKAIFGKWIHSIRNEQEHQKIELEKRAKQSAKCIVDMEDKLPEVAQELFDVAQFEESRASQLRELEDACKITHQVEKAQEVKENKKRKKRTRTRTNP